MLKKLIKIRSTQWYYEYDPEEIFAYCFYESKKGDLEASGQKIASSCFEYSYTHGGNEYRKAVEAFWKQFPDYRKD